MPPSCGILLGNKLYSKVWDAYKPFYMALDMADEILVPMYHNFIVASLILNDYTMLNHYYKLMSKRGKNDDVNFIIESFLSLDARWGERGCSVLQQIW